MSLRARIVQLSKRSPLYVPLKRARDAALTLRPSERKQRRRETRFYAQFIRPGDLVFDVGANLGKRTRVFLALGARVVAVEPRTFCVGELRWWLGRDLRVHIVPSAVGAAEGEGEMFMGDAHTLNTLSAEWMETVKMSGRFGAEGWHEVQHVAITTLDGLVARFGVPRFCKIDVEGFELQALSGLSTPIRALSFEFVPEYPNHEACVERLGALGDYRFNYSLREDMELALESWVTPAEIVRMIAGLESGNDWGDIYARLEPPAPVPGAGAGADVG